MKYSKQREIVKKAIVNNYSHPSALEIYDKIKKDNPKISLATVYRNLNLLSENGDILKIENSYGSDRFDFQTHKHHHLFCKECGRVYDISSEELDAIEELIEKKLQFIVSDFHLEGTCKDCKKQN